MISMPISKIGSLARIRISAWAIGVLFSVYEEKVIQPEKT